MNDYLDFEGLSHFLNNLLAVIDKPKSYISLVDQVNGYTYYISMRDGELVSYCQIESIAVTTMPDRVKYAPGEHFDPTGMVITATCADGTTREITDYTYTTDPLVEGTTSVSIIYSENGVDYELPVAITCSMASILTDFTYSDNGDGTYTITGWDGTYNGEASTEIVIPDYENIIV